MNVEITTEYITLDKLIKLSGAAGTGGQAKIMILEGEASVNGEVCLQRGKKIYPGYTVKALGEEITVSAKAP